MDAGADVCVVSVHKMGAGFEQGSVYHIQGDLIDRERLTACADLLMTTSPSVPIYAALDGWRRQMVQHGNEMLDAACKLARDVRARIDELPDVAVLDDVLLGAEASHDLDRLQVLVDVAATGTSGYQARDWLREQRCLDVGLADHRRILATLSFADDRGSTDRLLDALSGWRDAARSFDPPAPIRLPSPEEMQLESVQLPATRSSAAPRWLPHRRPPAVSRPSSSRPIRPASRRWCPANASTPRSSTICGPVWRPEWRCRTPPTPPSSTSWWWRERFALGGPG